LRSHVSFDTSAESELAKGLARRLIGLCFIFSCWVPITWLFEAVFSAFGPARARAQPQAQLPRRMKVPWSRRRSYPAGAEICEELDSHKSKLPAMQHAGSVIDLSLFGTNAPKHSLKTIQML
jgi:hypothetical protein